MVTTGEKPGTGTYYCTNCGEDYNLDQDSDTMPPCRHCNGTDFCGGFYSDYDKDGYGPEYDDSSKTWEAKSTFFAGKGDPQKSAYEQYKAKYGTMDIDGDSVSGASLPDSLNGSSISERFEWGTQIKIEEVTYVPDKGDKVTKKIINGLKVPLIDRGPGIKDWGRNKAGLDLTPKAYNDAIQQAGLDPSLEKSGNFKFKFKILLP